MSDSYQSPYYHSPIDGHDHFTETGRHECAICALETDRDRLRAIIEDVADALTPEHLDPGEWDHAPDAIRDIIAETNLTQAALHRADDIHDRWALAVVERDAAETERDRMRAERDRLRAVADAARTLVQELDANPIGEYGDAVCEAIDQLDTKLQTTKEAT